VKKKENAGQKAVKIRWPIGFKLVAIISILLLFSLSLITALVSVMVSSDVRITAEDNNLSINSRSAAEAESALSSIRSNALVLLDTLAAAGNSPALSRQAAAFFFERNQDVAAIAVLNSSSSPSTLLINDRFFFSNAADSTLVDSFLASSGGVLERAAAGETLILNGMPAFGIPLLVLCYPWSGSGSNGAVAVFFSSESLSETFETGANSSYMINGEGDVLVHQERDLIRAGANFGNQSFIRSIWENPGESMQSLYTAEDGGRYFGAFTKLSLASVVVITDIAYDVVFEGIRATTRRNIYLTIAVLLASVIFIRIFSKTISKPLQVLTAAAEQIEGGQFEIALKPKTRDEIGVLTLSFGRMSTALGIFGRFTNREIAVRAMRGEIKPGGFPKHATIFFSDIREFTAKSENFTKEYGEEASDRIVHWLNDYFTRMVDCVEKTGGVVDKFIGDAVMAHWGTAYSSGSVAEDAFNCVKAALLMRAALLEMNQPQIITRLTILLSERIWFIYKQLANTLITDPLGRMYDALLIQLEKNRVAVDEPAAYTFDFGPKELINMVGIPQKDAAFVLGKIMKDKMVQVLNDKIHAADVVEIARQSEFYKRTDKITKARQEMAGRV
jgi:adenylate cyclase